MNRIGGVIIKIIALILFIVLISFIIHRYNRMKESIVVNSINLNIDTLSTRFVTEEHINNILNETNIVIGETKIVELSLDNIEECLENDIYIDNATAYADIYGVLNIDITQFPPIMRMIDTDGASYYIDHRLRVVPKRGSVIAPITIVSQSDNIFPLSKLAKKSEVEENTELTKDDTKMYDTLNWLTRFVRYIDNSEIYSEMFTQININKEREVILFPRIGNHHIVFSCLDSLHNYEGQMQKLDKFYRSQSDKGGWSEYKSINLKYDGQVVAKKRDK